MNRVMIVARNEFLSNVRKRSFLWTALGVPLFSVAIMVVVFAITANTAGSGDVPVERLGYVDQAGILGLAEPDFEGTDFENLQLISFEDVDAARAALDAEEINAYAVVPSTYMRTGLVQTYAFGTISRDLTREFDRFISANLAAAADSDASADLLRQPVIMEVFLENNQRILEEDGFIGLFLAPLIFSIVFLLAIQISGSLLMSGVVEEKTNRIMEVLITSLRPDELLAGKILGLGLLGLLQVGIWLLAGALLLVVGQSNVAIASVSIPPDLIIVALLFFVMAYLLYGSLLAGLGAASDSEEESRQYAGIVSILVVIPVFFIVEFLTNPNGGLAVALSLIPFTAPIAVLLRMSFGVMPFTEVLLSLGLMLVTSIIITWLSARIFRWGMLRTGQRLRVRDLFTAITSRPKQLPAQRVSREESI